MAHGMARRAGRLAGPGGSRGRSLGTTGEAQPVNLADDGIACNASAQFSSDLAGTQTLVPELLQKFNSLIGPGHWPHPLSQIHLAESVPHRRLAAAKHGTEFSYKVDAALDVVFDGSEPTIGSMSVARLGRFRNGFSPTIMAGGGQALQGSCFSRCADTHAQQVWIERLR